MAFAKEAGNEAACCGRLIKDWHGKWNMEKSARAFAFLALAAAMLVFAGCAQSSAPANGSIAGNATFVLPEAEASYYARYTVEDGGTMAKEVWRAPDKMRIDLSVDEMLALSFFFMDSRAYSCDYLPLASACYDITATLSQADAKRMMPLENDMASATRLESVKIGSLTGACYAMPSGALGYRKLCFAPQGVVAYDSYNVSKTSAHTEYATEIEYFEEGRGPGASVFLLPAAPGLEK